MTLNVRLSHGLSFITSNVSSCVTNISKKNVRLLTESKSPKIGNVYPLKTPKAPTKTPNIENILPFVMS